MGVRTFAKDGTLLTGQRPDTIRTFLKDGTRIGGPGGGGGGGVQVGIESFQNGYTQSLNNFQWGWEFTVGAADIEVSALRHYQTQYATVFDFTAHIWRVSDQAELVSIDIASPQGEWGRSELATPVVLSAGANYIVSIDTPGPYRVDDVASDIVFNEAVTYVQERQGSVGSNFPPNTQENRLLGFADMEFVVQ